MTRIRFALLFLVCLVRSVWQRWRRRGPSARWTLWQEAMIDAIRRGARAMERSQLSVARRQVGSLWSARRPRRDVAREELILGGVPVLRFVPNTMRPDAPTVLYVHGGAYAFGSPREYAAHIAAVAAAVQGPVFAPDYRLAPEHRFPASLDDVCAAYRAIVESIAPRGLVLAGDSAGGALVVSCLVRLRAESGAGAENPAGAVLLSPWVDLSASGGSMVEHVRQDWATGAYLRRFAELYLGDVDARDPAASPAFADLRGLPPLRIQIGALELLHDQVVSFAAAARSAGVDVQLEVWPDMVHGFWMMPPWFPAERSVAHLARWAAELVAAARSPKN